MDDKPRKAIDYLLDRLKEQSTWQGIGFVVALTGSHFGAGMDWGQAAGLGGALSALLKIMLSDQPKKGV